MHTMKELQLPVDFLDPLLQLCLWTSVQGRRFPPELGRVHSHSPFHPSPSLPSSLPVPSISSTSLSPPLCYSSLPFPCPSILNPLPHPQPPNPSAIAFACVLGWEIAASGDEFRSWFPWPYMGVSNTFTKLGRVHYGMDPIGLISGWKSTPLPPSPVPLYLDPAAAFFCDFGAAYHK